MDFVAEDIPRNTAVLALDIGGSHVSASVITWRESDYISGPTFDVTVDSQGSAEDILGAWTLAAKRAREAVSGITGVGVAMPGPFDYENGICTMQGVDKYDRLYGTNVRAEFKRRLGLSASQEVLFENDAGCFALGEFWAGAARYAKSVIGITIGTGLGSGFCTREGLVRTGASVPEDGWLYNQPFGETMADDRFSTRGLLSDWRRAGGHEVKNVRELAALAEGDSRVREVFHAFGSDLAAFLSPWVSQFEAEVVVVGGNISRAWPLFENPFVRQMAVACPNCRVLQSELMESAALLGAARLPLMSSASL